MVIPGLPFDEYKFCVFQPWRAGKITFTVISLVYGTSLSVVQYPHCNGQHLR